MNLQQIQCTRIHSTTQGMKPLTSRPPFRRTGREGGTYKVVAGEEGAVLQHRHAVGAVAGGAVDLAAAAVTDVAGGVGNLPAVDEQCRVLALAHHGAVGQGQVVGWVAVAIAWLWGYEQTKASLWFHVDATR